MNHLIKKMLICCTLFFAASSFALAQSDSTPRFALVIGNQNYQEGKLSNPIADANLIASQLQECGFEVTKALDLSVSDFLTTVGTYADKVKASGSNTISFFYYSGHGVQIGGKNYLVPVDNKDITTEVLAQAKCFCVDTFFTLVNSSTQIVVLDACRNNPFASTKETFSKGLTTINAPKNVKDFMALFSTGPGQTAEDGKGKNSLFTETLASKMTQLNVPVVTVFNDVASEVKEKTQGRQIPNISGTSVNFELMNSSIAEAKIKSLQNQIKKIEQTSKTDKSKNYSSEKKLLEEEIKKMQEIKTKAKADAVEKAKEKARQDEIKKKNQNELARIQKQNEAAKKALQQQKASQKSSATFIKEIEDNKNALQKIRTTAAEKIYNANEKVQAAADDKIEKIEKEPVSISEQDGNGNLTSKAKKARKNRQKAVQKDADEEKKQNYSDFHSVILDEENERINTMNADLKTLKSATYAASSILGDVTFETGKFNSNTEQWIVSLDINLFEKKNLFTTTIELPLKELYTKVLDQKFVSIKKLDEVPQDYEENVELYDALFHQPNPPLIVEVEYKIEGNSSDSTYSITTSKVNLYYMSDKEILLNSKTFFKKTSVTWNSSYSKLMTVEEILEERYDEDKKLQKEMEKKAKEASANKVSTSSSSSKNSTRSKNSTGSKSSGLSSLANSIKTSGTKYSLKGLGLDLIFSSKGSGFNMDYLFSITDYIFAGPYLNVILDDIVGLGGKIGINHTIDFHGLTLQPYVYSNIGFETVSSEENGETTSKESFVMGFHGGCAWRVNDYFSLRTDLGADFSKKSRFVFSAGCSVDIFNLY